LSGFAFRAFARATLRLNALVQLTHALCGVGFRRRSRELDVRRVFGRRDAPGALRHELDVAVCDEQIECLIKLQR
jgi:hypothetical protein